MRSLAKLAVCTSVAVALLAPLQGSERVAFAGRPVAKSAVAKKKSAVAKKKSLAAKERKSKLTSGAKESLQVYHASNGKFTATQLKTNSDGLVHVSTRASFSAQYGANLSTFKLRDKQLFRLEQHKANIGDRKVHTAEGSLGINVHRDFELHATLKGHGFRGYEYKQWDDRRDRYITNFALFDVKLLKPKPTH